MNTTDTDNELVITDDLEASRKNTSGWDSYMDKPSTPKALYTKLKDSGVELYLDDSASGPEAVIGVDLLFTGWVEFRVSLKDLKAWIDSAEKSKGY